MKSLSVEEQLEERKEWALKHDLNLDELDKILFIVTIEGNPMVVCLNNNINILKIGWRSELTQNGITPAIIYDGFWHTGISTEVDIWDKDGAKPQYRKYQSNAAIRLTVDDCVATIIKDCNGVVTYL